MYTPSRRQALALLAAGSASLAGCSEASDDVDDAEDAADDTDSDDETETPALLAELEGEEPPAYASVIPADTGTDTETTFVTAIDLETVLETIDDDPGEGSTPDDPLLRNAVAVVSLGLYGLFALSASPVGEVQATAEGDPDGATLLYLDGAYVIYGEYDVDVARNDLEAAGYEVSDGTASVVATDVDSSEAVGVTEELFVYAFGDGDRALEVTTAVVETARGDADAITDSSAPVAALLEATPETGISSLLYGNGEPLADLDHDTQADDADEVTFELGAFEGATGVTQTVAVEGGDSTVRALVTYESGAVDRERLESRLGEDAATIEFAADDSRVGITAEYGEDVVDD